MALWMMSRSPTVIDGNINDGFSENSDDCMSVFLALKAEFSLGDTDFCGHFSLNFGESYNGSLRKSVDWGVEEKREGN